MPRGSVGQWMAISMTQRVAFSIRGAPARLPGPVQLLRHLPPLRHRLVRQAPMMMTLPREMMTTTQETGGGEETMMTMIVVKTIMADRSLTGSAASCEEMPVVGGSQRMNRFR